MNAALLTKLIEAGTPAELVAEVAVELGRAQVEHEAIERQREQNRERQRRFRSRDVTENNVTERDERDPSPLKVSPQTPPPKTPNQCTPLNPPKSRTKKAVSIQAPDWMPVDPWLAFVAMRERMAQASRGKVIWSEDAAKGVISKLDRLRLEGHCPAKLLEKAVVSSWRTVFPDEDTLAPKDARASSMTATEWRERAESYVRLGMQDNAEECRRKAIALEQRQAA